MLMEVGSEDFHSLWTALTALGISHLLIKSRFTQSDNLQTSNMICSVQESTDRVNSVATPPSLCHEEDTRVCFLSEMATLPVRIKNQMPGVGGQTLVHTEGDQSSCSLHGGPSKSSFEKDWLSGLLKKLKQ